MPRREPAKKARIFEIVSGKYFPGNKLEMNPSYVITFFGEKISRASLLATVVEKYESEEKNFSTLTIDDESGAIRVKTFGENVKILEKIQVGDLVLVVGKIKNYDGENYIQPEVVRKIEDANYENLWKLEVLNKLIEQKRIIDSLKSLRELTEEELESYAKEKYELDPERLQVILENIKAEVDYKPKILEIIEKLDEGDGVPIEKLLEFSSLSESIVESTINDLLASGLLYEPVVGRLKKV